jgi:hypothetical protein
LPASACSIYLADSSRRHYISEEIKKLGKGNITAKIFTFRELCVATQNFRSENLLGEGGFGRVYKGHIASTNQAQLQPIFSPFMYKEKDLGNLLTSVFSISPRLLQ